MALSPAGISTGSRSSTARVALLAKLWFRPWRIGRYGNPLQPRILRRRVQLRAHSPARTRPVDGSCRRCHDRTCDHSQRPALGLGCGRGFSEFGPLPENTFALFATVPQSLNFLARVDGVPAVNRLHHAPSWNCGPLWLCYHSGTSRPWRADRANQPPFGEAAQAGGEYAVVSALPGSGSQSNMERRGFRVAYTKIVMVRTWPESANSGAEHGH